MVVDEVVPLADKALPRTVPHLSDEERKAKGKLAREKCPRDSHAAFEPGPDRPDPVALLESQAPPRVPELVPIRYGRMLVSPFTFFRGAALVMASDLSTGPRTGLTAQICGDAHLSNFGVFGSPERQLVFDCNDFDETLPGPWEWDVKRLAASVVVAARGLGFSKANRAGGDHPPRPALPRGHAGNGGGLEPGRLVLQRGDRSARRCAHAARRRDGLQGGGPHGGDRNEGDVEGQDQGLHAGVEQARPASSTDTDESSATHP